MHILARKTSSIEYRPIPLEAKEQISALLIEAYEDDLAKSQKIIDIYGLIYPEEFVLALTVMDQEGRNLIPRSLLLSVDFDAEKSSFQDLLPIFLEGCDAFLAQALNWNDDDMFSEDVESPYLGMWTEELAKDVSVFTKVTRENIALTLMADEILKEENLNWQ